MDSKRISNLVRVREINPTFELKSRNSKKVHPG